MVPPILPSSPGRPRLKGQVRSQATVVPPSTWQEMAGTKPVVLMRHVQVRGSGLEPSTTGQASRRLPWLSATSWAECWSMHSAGKASLDQRAHRGGGSHHVGPGGGRFQGRGEAIVRPSRSGADSAGPRWHSAPFSWWNRLGRPHAQTLFLLHARVRGLQSRDPGRCVDGFLPGEAPCLGCSPGGGTATEVRSGIEHRLTAPPTDAAGARGHGTGQRWSASAAHSLPVLGAHR